MAITFDPAKRDETLAERDLNFEDAEIVFAGVTLEVEDTARITARLGLSASAS
jgi:hypothetical protein